jgi:hypothetical protein
VAVGDLGGAEEIFEVVGRNIGGGGHEDDDTRVQDARPQGSEPEPNRNADKRDQSGIKRGLCGGCSSGELWGAGLVVGDGSSELGKRRGNNATGVDLRLTGWDFRV